MNATVIDFNYFELKRQKAKKMIEARILYLRGKSQHQALSQGEQYELQALLRKS